MSSGYSQSASLRGSTPNNCSAVYQEELALLLIQASPHTAYCFSQLKQGTYLIWLKSLEYYKKSLPEGRFFNPFFLKRLFCFHKYYLFQCSSSFKSIAHLFAKTDICVVKRIKRDRCSFCYIYISVFVQNTFVHADIYDLTNQTAGFFVVAFQFTFYTDGKLFDDGASTFSDFSAVNPAFANLSGSLFPETIPT